MLSSEPRTAQRISSFASTVFSDSLERASVMVRLTAECLSPTGQSWLRCRGCTWQPQTTVEILLPLAISDHGAICVVLEIGFIGVLIMTGIISEY